MRIKWRGLELPNRLTCERETLTDTYGKFFAEPFERGFGVTIGNSLRRVLLSSLEGSAITRVKIQGVQHEITTIPGISEDVTDIILNIKSLVVKNASEQPRTIRIDRHEKGVVTAANLITDEAVQIINPEHIIATLTDDVPFVLEMTIENGRGYRTAEENAGKEREIGIIPVDSSFSPVVRVKYEIEETRVGQRQRLPEPQAVWGEFHCPLPHRAGAAAGVCAAGAGGAPGCPAAGCPVGVLPRMLLICITSTIFSIGK